jgi:hypothetical protein
MACDRESLRACAVASVLSGGMDEAARVHCGFGRRGGVANGGARALADITLRARAAPSGR